MEDTTDTVEQVADTSDQPARTDDVLSAFDAMILDDAAAVDPAPTEAMPVVAESADDDLSAMPPPSVPSDMPPPSPPSAVLGERAPERASDDDLVLDPKALKALSRQERKDAKAAVRREAKEARESARRARAEAKLEAKADLTDDVDDLSGDEGDDRPTEHIDPVAEAAELLAEPAPADMPPPVMTPPVVAPAVTPPAEESRASTPADMPPPTPTGTDPRSRAAARVQRRLGRDAEKVSAAETRARAREEARRRRVQAKELRTGSAVAEAAEAVVRMPDEAPDITAEIPAVTAEIPVVEESVFEESVVEDSVVDDAATELIPPVAETPEMTHEYGLGEVDPGEMDSGVETPGATDENADFEDVDELEDPEADAAEFVPPSVDDPIFDEFESTSTQPVPDDLPAPVVTPAAQAEPVAPKWAPEPVDEPSKKSGLGPVAGVIGLIALAISVLLAVSALAVALGVDSGGVYNALQAMADTLVGPLKSAFDFSGSNAERKEHFLAWGAGSLGYLVISFIGQAVQRANSDDD